MPKLWSKVISQDLKVLIKPSHRKLTLDLHKIIEKIWLKKKKDYFNGQIFCIFSISRYRIYGDFFYYKEILAQNQLRLINPYTPLYTLGVSGIIIIDSNHILFGTRSKKVSTYSGFFELASSGGLDPSALTSSEVCYKKAILTEFEQETSISSKHVTRITPFLLIYDHHIRGYDICLEVHVDIKIDDLNVSQTDEYSSLFLLHIDKVAEFIKKNRKNIMPSSLAILNSSYIQQKLLKKIHISIY